MPTLSAPNSSSTEAPPRPFVFKEALDRNFPSAYPCDAFPIPITPIWHESEELNRLCERVSGRDSNPIHEQTP